MRNIQQGKARGPATNLCLLSLETHGHDLLIIALRVNSCVEARRVVGLQGLVNGAVQYRVVSNHYVNNYEDE